MLKCTPYIKSICNSLNSALLWKDGSNSLPASPNHQPWPPPSPTRSESGVNYDSSKCGAGGGVGGVPPAPPPPIQTERELLMFASTEPDGTVKTTLVDVDCASVVHGGSSTTLTACPASNLINVSGGGSNLSINSPSSSIKSSKTDLINHVLFKKIRPESPDVTRAAKKMENMRNLGAISKIPSSPSSSNSSNSSRYKTTTTKGAKPFFSPYNN